MPTPITLGLRPSPNITRLASAVAKTTEDVLCAGIYGDHTACSVQANVYYLADAREVCTLPHEHQIEDLLVTPRQWFESYRPCWTWGTSAETGLPRVVFSQPSSTFFVMLAAALCLWVGFKFWKSWREPGMYHLSRLLWAFSMCAWGLGAFLAGLSYEALEWHLKCSGSGSTYCLAYSWMELVYVVLQVGACNSIFIAVAYSSQVCTSVIVPSLTD